MRQRTRHTQVAATGRPPNPETPRTRRSQQGAVKTESEVGRTSPVMPRRCSNTCLMCICSATVGGSDDVLGLPEKKTLDRWLRWEKVTTENSAGDWWSRRHRNAGAWSTRVRLWMDRLVACCARICIEDGPSEDVNTVGYVWSEQFGERCRDTARVGAQIDANELCFQCTHLDMLFPGPVRLKS